MHYLYLVYLMLFVLTGCSLNSRSIHLSTPHYAATVDIFEPDKSQQHNNAALIMFHGKQRGRNHPCNYTLASSLTEKGFTIYAPEMPWGERYSATVQEAFRFMDKLVTKAAHNKKKIYLAGHSQGATMALLYVLAYKPHPAVKGIIMLAPGHILHAAMYMRDETAASVKRARKLVKHGVADKKYYFIDINSGKHLDTYTTARIYLSYFDPDIFPNMVENLPRLKVPLLWIDGKDDPLADNLDYPGIFDYSKKLPGNLHTVVPGGHVGMCDNSVKTIMKWLNKL